MKSVIAAFPNRDVASQAMSELGTSGVEPGSTRMIDEVSNGATIMRTLVEHDVPRERAEQYAEGVRRGAVLLVADTNDEDADRIADLLDSRGSIDLDSSSERWRSAGWSGYRDDAQPLGEDERRAELSSFERDNLDREGREGLEGESLDVIEEDVAVGKREVSRGGVRVRAFVTERPIREALELREEHINVTREPADEPLTATDSTFTEQEFEVTATGEEPVIEKRTRVVERVRVDKDVDTHTEQIEATERKRDVEVEPVEPQIRRH